GVGDIGHVLRAAAGADEDAAVARVAVIPGRLAVALDVAELPRGHGDVVAQARVGDAVVVGGVGPVGHQAVDVGRVRAVDQRLLAGVLHGDDGDVLEQRN